ncbi:MAG: serine hydrolase domain-containing protein [Candidatus Odinarchaeota archaeon]
MREEIETIVNSLFALPKNLGLVVGVIKRDQITVTGYGKARDTVTEQPRGDTLFEIGSVTKVFTTTLLSLLVSEKLLDLDDPVCDLMPKLSNLPAEITPARLATHTSGLPKMPSGIFWTTRRNRRNPFAKYPSAKLFEYLSGYKSKRKLSDKIQYSNLGGALLGHILAYKLNMSYEQAVVNRICDGFDMPDTRMTLTSEQKERLATPHSGNGKPSHNWDLSAFAGAGALRSTANDLLKFLVAYLGKSQSALKEVLEFCLEQRNGSFTRPGRLLTLLSGSIRKKRVFDPYRQGIALGWVIGHVGAEGPRVHWHHGGTGGYTAFAGFVKSREIGAVVLFNRGPRFSEAISGISMADEIGFRILEHFCSS